MHNSAPIFWLIGLSGTGKTTLGSKLYDQLNKERKAEHIDGDVVRGFFGGKSGYSREERTRVSKEMAFAAKLLSDQGVSVVVSNISGSHDIQNFLTEKLGDQFHLIYLKTTLEAVKERDVKGIYERYSQGKESSVVGLDLAFEEPQSPALVINTAEQTEAESWQSLKTFADSILNS